MLENKKISRSTPQDTKNRANRRVGPVFCVPIHGVQKCPQKFIVASAGFVICDLKLFF